MKLKRKKEKREKERRKDERMKEKRKRRKIQLVRRDRPNGKLSRNNYTNFSSQGLSERASFSK